MGFKSDREFLRNISIGAVGTMQVAAVLRQGGFQIIELERYSTSNKIWATKIKRLRVPDLLCLRTGIRFESRGKATLKVAMSHSINNEDRAWDKGLRDDDLVAFIQCRCNEQGIWIASPHVALFKASDMRAAEEVAGLSRMKAASEGSEIQLTWPARIPNQRGKVIDITEDKIICRMENGRRQSYSLRARRNRTVYPLHSHVNVGDEFEAGDQIIASAMPTMIQPICPSSEQYDFVADLDSQDREAVYAAAKALGFLPDFTDRSIPALNSMATSHDDPLLRLEAATALARLEVEEGWMAIFAATTADNNIQVRMESALILSEFDEREHSLPMLSGIANDPSNPSELRAAAVWGLGQYERTLDETPLLNLLTDDDETVAVHSLVAISRLVTDAHLPDLLELLGQNQRQSACIAKAILLSSCDSLPHVAAKLTTATSNARLWLLYLLACMGREHCEDFLRRSAPDVLDELNFFWTYHSENWTSRLDVADQLDFLSAQILSR